MVVVAEVRDGGGPSVAVSRVVEVIWEWCVTEDIALEEVVWVPSESNVEADFESRVVDSDDWRVGLSVFREAERRWGPHTVDRFASEHNTFLPRFNASRWCPGVEAVDAWAEVWSEENNWAVPPLSRAGAVLALVEEQKACATVVLPNWPAQPWWPLLQRLEVSSFLITARDLVESPSGVREPWRHLLWQFRVARVDGRKDWGR